MLTNAVNGLEPPEETDEEKKEEYELNSEYEYGEEEVEEESN